jgi:hypothetical protein
MLETLEEIGQRDLDGVPDNVKVDIEIAVSDTRDSQEDVSRSYRARLSQYLVAELDRQVFGREHIDVNAEHRLQLVLQTAQIEKRGSRQRVDENIEIASFPVRAVQHGTENTRIGRAVAPCRLAHSGTMTRQQQ